MAGEYNYVSDPYCEVKTKAGVEAARPKWTAFKPASGYKKRGPGQLDRETGEPYKYEGMDHPKGPTQKVALSQLTPFRPTGGKRYVIIYIYIYQAPISHTFPHHSTPSPRSLPPPPPPPPPPV